MRRIVLKLILLVGVWLLVFINMTLSKGQDTSENEKVEVVNTPVKKKQPQEHMVRVMHNGKEEEMELESYLAGVIASEMPYTFEKEALKAQCVAARTYVMQRGLKVDDSTSSQVYHSQAELKEIHDENYEEMQNVIHQVLEETKGEVMMYDGNYISAMFYSSNNGFSNDASWYYKNEVPYLKSVSSIWDTQFENTNAVVEKSVEECKAALGVSSFLIQNMQTYENGYIKTMTIGGKVFTGRQVREALGLRSSCFSMEIKGDYVHIYTRGYGHGVGMSQYGALGMAKEGYTYHEILTHYYTGVEIVNLNDRV